VYDLAEEPVSPHVAAHRAGLSPATLVELAAAVAAHSGGEVTAADIAAALGIERPSASRTLKQLGRLGPAPPVGTVGSGAGRPAVRYAVRRES
jgi:predicted ArsR family transcriptional regulator